MKIIAEAGCNFRNLEEAIQMINESKRLGLWATKFQCYNHKIIMDNPNYKFLRSIMIEKDEAMILFEHGREIGQKVFFTPMYLEAVDWLEDIGVEMYKIRYLDQENQKLINKIKQTNKKIFISTDHWDNFDNIDNIIVFECIPKYPAKVSDYTLEYCYEGISDHTSNLYLLKHYGEEYNYWEKHVKLDGTKPLEDKWSVSFSKLEEVLK